MGKRPLAWLTLALALAGCADGTAPRVGDVSGTWAWGQVESSYVVTIVQGGGDTLIGTGTWYRNINPPTIPVSVNGSHRAGAIHLRVLWIDGFLDFDGATTVRHDSTLMTGTATTMVDTTHVAVTFVRQD